MYISNAWNQLPVGRVGSPPGRPAPAPEQAALPAADQVQIDATPNRYLEQPDGGKIGLPENGRFEIGRQKECQVQIEGDLVSRRHCQAEYRNGQLWVRDESSNGTFVNGERLPQGQWTEVPRGSEIGFGQTVHTLTLGSAASSPGFGLQGPHGQSFDWPAGQQTVKVGRSDDSHLRPEDNLVSGNHALLRRQGDKLLVLDTQSRNGTFVNGERIDSMRWTEVPPGAQLAFGCPSLAWGDPH